MSESSWESVGFPPLRLSRSQLDELVAIAGPDATLMERGNDTIITARGMKLELTDHDATLRFDDRSAAKANELVQELAEQPTRLLVILLPLALGIAVFAPLAVLGFQLDLAAFIALAAMLLGMVATVLLSRSSTIDTNPLDDDSFRWRTRFSSKNLTFAELGEVARSMGEETTLVLEKRDEVPSVTLTSPGIELTLMADRGEVVFDDASSKLEKLYDKVLSHRKTLRWLTHDDLAIFAGMLLPIAAIALAPVDSKRLAALISVVPWLFYLVWILRNQRRHWCTIERSDEKASS